MSSQVNLMCAQIPQCTGYGLGERNKNCSNLETLLFPSSSACLVNILLSFSCSWVTLVAALDACEVK